MNVFIKAIDYYLPERCVENSEIVRNFPEWSVEKIASKVGIKKRYIADPNETAGDLAIAAAEKLFSKNNIDRKIIDFILFCTQSPDYLLPTTACIIQNKLELNTNIGAIDFNLGCSGYIYGLSLGKGLVSSGIAKNVLFLTGETYNKHLHPKDKGNQTIFGDAASATLISTDGFAEIGNFSFGTDGSGAGNLIIKTSACRHQSKKNDLSFDENSNPVSSDFLYMNGSEIFTFTLEKVPILVKETLLCNKLERDDIDMYIFHQANKYMLDFLRKKIKIEEDKFYYCLSEFGNTVSNTIPIAICEALRDGSVKNKQKVLIAGFGVGYSWGGTVLQF